MNSRLTNIKAALLLFALFAEVFFFGYNMVTGQDYAGAESSNRYLLFMAIVDLVPLFMFVKLLIKGPSDRRYLIYVALVLFIVISFLLSSTTNLLLIKPFIAYCVPASMVGIIIAKEGLFCYFEKWLEPTMLILTVIMIFSMGSILTAKALVDVGDEVGLGIQSISYYGAVAFSLNLHFILNGKDSAHRFGYTKIPFYNFFCVCLLVVQLVVVLSSGGRGGCLLLIISLLIQSWLKLKTTKRGLFKVVIGLCAILLFVSFSIGFLPSDIQEAISIGTERTFSYITKGGVDMSQTSNRDDVYSVAIDCFWGSPIIGYGLFSYLDAIKIGYPHNIFLEVLLQGGLLYLIFFLFIIYRFFVRLKSLLRRHHSKAIITLVLYPFVMLMFSGTYLGTGFFWFSVCYVFFASRNGCFNDVSSVSIVKRKC